MSAAGASRHERAAPSGAGTRVPWLMLPAVRGAMAKAAAPDRRRILCTTCDLPFEIAREAKSVNCPHCHNRVITEEMDISGYVAVRKFTTANRMRIRKKGRVYAAVRADDLEVEGFLQGEALALHGIRILKGAIVAAAIRAPRLVLDPGATLVGDVRIGPGEVPELENLWEPVHRDEPSESPPAT
jgi:hypothetical protein